MVYVFLFFKSMQKTHVNVKAYFLHTFFSVIHFNDKKRLGNVYFFLQDRIAWYTTLFCATKKTVTKRIAVKRSQKDALLALCLAILFNAYVKVYVCIRFFPI